MQKSLQVIRSAFPVLAIICASLACLSCAAVGRAPRSAARETWSFVGGYGETHPGWRETETRVQTIDGGLRYDRVIYPDIGSSWYRGDHSLLIEGLISRVGSPVSGYMAGMNFMAAHTFTSHETVQPYIFIGGGPVYVGADIPGMGTRLNGNYQAGLGVRRKIGEKRHLLFEYRYYHISNGGRREPNVPLDGSKFMIGFTF